MSLHPTFKLLPDGRARHFTGAFVTLRHQPVDVTVHLDTLADQSRFVANVVDIGGTDNVVIDVPETITVHGLDGFLSVVYHQCPDRTLETVPDIMDALGFFDATPDTWERYDAMVRDVVPGTLDRIVWDGIARAVRDYRLNVMMPHTWSLIRHVRRPESDPPLPKAPDAFARLAQLMLPLPPTQYVVPTLASELVHRKSWGRRIPPTPRRKDQLVQAVNDDNEHLLAEAMGLESIAPLRALCHAMQRGSRFLGFGADYTLTYRGAICKRVGTEYREVAPPILPDIDLSLVRGYGLPYVRLVHPSHADRVRDELRALFFELPPRLLDLVN